MDRFLKIRNESIAAAQTLLAHFEGKPIADFDAFNGLGISIYDFNKFYQNNNTFQELTNSGNLAPIANDTIKNYCRPSKINIDRKGLF